MSRRDDARPERVRLAIAVAVSLAVALGLVLAGRFGDDPRAIDSPVVGRAAPAFDLPRLDAAGRASLADYRGQVVVVNFWASWCAPCRREHGELAEVAAAYRSAGVSLVGIAAQDERGDAEEFLDEFGAPYEMLLDDARTAIDYGLFGLPETFVIDESGTVRHKFTGPVTAESLGAALDQLLAGA